MSPEPPRLTVDRADDVLVLAGEVDAYTAPILQEHIGELDDVGELTLDMAQVSFIDSSGLRVIVAAHQDREDRQARLVLRSNSPAVERVLEITSLTDHLHCA